MYHAIVKRIALQNFLRVNRKDYAASAPWLPRQGGGQKSLCCV